MHFDRNIYIYVDESFTGKSGAWYMYTTQSSNATLTVLKNRRKKMDIVVSKEWDYKDERDPQLEICYKLGLRILKMRL